MIGILARELKLTIILIEHDISVVMGISDEIMVLYEGRKLVEGTPGGNTFQRDGAERLPGQEGLRPC